MYANTAIATENTIGSADSKAFDCQPVTNNRTVSVNTPTLKIKVYKQFSFRNYKYISQIAKKWQVTHLIKCEIIK